MIPSKFYKLAIISHITIIGCLVSMVQHTEQKHPFSSFYIRQALGLHLLFFALGNLISFADNWTVTGILYGAYLTMLVLSLHACTQKEEKALPFIGNYFQKWFHFL